MHVQCRYFNAGVKFSGAYIYWKLPETPPWLQSADNLLRVRHCHTAQQTQPSAALIGLLGRESVTSLNVMIFANDPNYLMLNPRTMYTFRTDI